jgi:hypothetical protein
MTKAKVHRHYWETLILALTIPTLQKTNGRGSW